MSRSTHCLPSRHRVEARVLGGFRVVVDGRALGTGDWGRSSAERLFKLLLVTPGHRLSREVAAEHLWPEAEPKRQAANLRKAIHFARRALATGGEVTMLAADRTHVSFGPEIELSLDLDRVTDAAERPDGVSNWATDTELLIAMGGGELLPDDPYEEWLAAPRERVAARWTAAAVAAARAALAAGDIARTSRLVDALLARDPADEEAHRLAIQMLAAQGRHHAARRQFFVCRRELSEAFGVEPSPETVAALAVAEASATERAAGPAHTLVGREAVLARIDELVERLRSGAIGVLVVRGPAGIGKTRLLEEATSVLAASGWRVLTARSAELDPELAFGALRTAFRGVSADEIARWTEPGASAMALLLPSRGVRPALPFSRDDAVETGILSAIEQMSAKQPVALVIDDAQWLDGGSAQVLSRMSGASVERPFLLALGVRTDENAPDHVRELLDRLGRLDGEDVELGPIGKIHTAPLVTPHLGGARLDPAVVDLLFERSRGNPLFCLELARVLRDAERLVLRGGTWQLATSLDTADVPPTVIRLVRSRSSRLPHAAVDLLALAAEFDEPVSFDHLVRGSGLAPEAGFEALDQALAAGLLVEAPAGYRFAHPLFRAAFRQDVPAAPRSHILLQVARTLAGDVEPSDASAVAAASDAGVDPLGVAERALVAAESGLAVAAPLAIGFGLEAGIREARLFQRDKALAILDRALSLWDALPTTDRERFDVSPAFATRGRVLVTQRREVDARESFRQAIGTARNSEQAGAAYADLAFVDYRHGDYGSSLATLREGLSRARDDLLAAIILTEMGWLEFRHQQLDESLAHLREAESVFRRAGSEVWLMRALDCLWGPLESMGRGHEAMPGLERALAIAEGRRDAVWEARVRVHLGFRLVRAGTPAQARPHVERALRLGEMIGDPLNQMIGLWAMAEMDFALGDLEAADRSLAAKLEVIASAGGNPRQEAIAHAFRTHVARARGEETAARDFETQAMRAAAKASRGDEAFGRRIRAYLDAPAWTPMSM